MMTVAAVVSPPSGVVSVVVSVPAGAGVTVTVPFSAPTTALAASRYTTETVWAPDPTAVNVAGPAAPATTGSVCAGAPS